MKHTCLQTAFILLLAASVARAVLIDDFGSTDSPAPWIFTNGPEYPGATGSLKATAGHAGAGARLAFDVSAGGNYVGAIDNLAKPTTAGAIQFWVKNPGGVRIQVRVNDSTGQTLQYSPSRPFQASAPAAWYLLTVKLGPTANHWGGGVNDGKVHGLITTISILAQPSLRKVGAIEFDQVKLIPALPRLIDPAGAVVETPQVKNFSNSLGVQITHKNATPAGLDLVQSLGFHYIRTEMFWTDVETQAGVYDFSWYDQLGAELKARGLQPIFILCYGNPIYTGEANYFLPPRTPAAITGFGNYARTAAAHFAGQGARFEIWNEPDIATFWNPPSAAEYSALCQATIAQIHDGDPNALVASGELAGIDLGFLNQVLADGGVEDSNALGIHPYRLGIPEQLGDDLAQLRGDVERAFPQNAPAIWSTEAGYSSAWYGDGAASANLTTQAKFDVRQMLTGLGLGLPLQIVFGLADDGTNASNTEDNFGIVSASYAQKPLTAAVRTLSKMTRNHTFAGILPSPQEATHVFKFEGPSDTLLVLWGETAAAGAQTISFTEQPKKVVDSLGNSLSLTKDGQGRFAVAVSDTPIYARFAASQQ